MNYYNPKCIQYKINIKQLWKVINQVIGKIIEKPNCIDCIKVDNIGYYQPKDISNHLGKYFADIGQNFTEKIPPPSKSILEYIDKITRNDKTLFLNLTKEQEIKKILTNYPIKTAADMIILVIYCWKMNHTIIKPLNYIFNLSVDSGEFPNLMKIAEIIPLYKSKARDSLTNYRLISLLLTISKLLEKIIYKRLYLFLEKTHSII